MSREVEERIRNELEGAAQLIIAYTQRQGRITLGEYINDIVIIVVGAYVYLEVQEEEPPKDPNTQTLIRGIRTNFEHLIVVGVADTKNGQDMLRSLNCNEVCAYNNLSGVLKRLLGRDSR